MADEILALADLSQKWNESLRGVLRHFCPNQVLSNQYLIEKGPNLLEQATLAKLNWATPHQFILMTAPSGVGKGTIGRILEGKGIMRVPRTITRARRPDEAETDYHFVEQNEYDKMLAADEFLCPTDFSTSATSCAGIEKRIFFSAINSGQPFYVDSGSGTAMKIKKESALSGIRFSVVFLLPPTFEEMVRRMRQRVGEEASKIQMGVAGGKPMDDDTISKRLSIATEHLAQSSLHTDLFVVNDEPNRAAAQILKLF